MSDTKNFDNPERRINLPSPRTLELLGKQKAGGLAPEEEGELRGLFAHPDDPVAQGLVKTEHLADLRLSEMNPEDRERLKQIRAEAYRRTQGENQRVRSESLQEGESRAGAWTDQLYALLTRAKIASLSEASWNGSPKLVIDAMIGEIPDHISIYTKDTLASMPKDEPTPLELYFLSRLQGSPRFEDTKMEGALPVMESILCLRDKIRTKKFMNGVNEAIQKLDKEDMKEITMVDAGCGTIPIMAIYAALSSEKVRCTAIELNPNSAEIARQLVASFNLQDRIQVVQGDATQFQPKEQIDLLVSETMHSGLTQEPMVEILSHLTQFVKPEGVSLPSRVTVQTALVPVDEWADPVGFVKIHGNLHHYVTPEWKPAIDYRPGDRLEEIQLAIPTQGRPSGSYLAMITSGVYIGSEELRPYESLITIPQVLRSDNSDPQIFNVKDRDTRIISVRYKPGEMLNGKAHLA